MSHSQKNRLVGKKVKPCPVCIYDFKLIVRQNKNDKTLFLGCENYPACDHTEPLSEHMRMELEGQPKLL